MIIILFIVTQLLSGSLGVSECQIPGPQSRTGCDGAFGGMTEQDCYNLPDNCCWDTSVPGVAWCYKGPPVIECNECCIPDVKKYTECFKDCEKMCMMPPVIEFENGQYEVNEADGSVEICFKRSGNLDGSSNVIWTTSQETASSNDFVGIIDDDLVFPPRSERQCSTITVLDDSDIETDETFQVFITSGTNATIGNMNIALVTIKDDDNN